MYKFIDTLEFKAFCKVVKIDWNNTLTMTKTELIDLITKSEVSEKAYQLEFSKQNIDPKILATFDKLGIPIIEQNKVLIWATATNINA